MLTINLRKHGVPFFLGMAVMWAVLTSAMTWTFSATHPRDNLLTFALEWPWRTYQLDKRGQDVFL